MANGGRVVLGWFAAITAFALPAIVDPGAIARTARELSGAGGLFPSGLEIIWLGIVVVSGLVLVLAPGLMLVLGLGTATNPAEWLLQGLLVSTVVVSVVVEVTEVALGGPLLGTTFGVTVWGVAAGAAAWAAYRARWVPDRSRVTLHTLAPALLGPFVFFALLVPKFLTESFNGDGAHAFESARLLLHRALPFWSPEAGGMANYPGVTTFLSSYPTAWFVRLFGEIEASARLPYLLFASAGLYAGLLAVVEAGRPKEEPDLATRWLLWAGLAVFTLVMGFSATYNPYHADLALPATEDALVIAWFLGLVWATATRRVAWVICFALCAYLTSPAGLVLLGLWLAAMAVFLRPFPRRELAALIVAIVLGALIGRTAPMVLAALGQPVPGSEHAAGGLLKRLLRVQWRDWHRILYFIIPAGVVPALALVLFRRFDSLGRAVAAVAVAQFLFFYLQARVSLHYFAPAMILPLATFWRIAPTLWPRRLVVATVLGGVAVGLAASWPADFRPHVAARIAGTKLEDRLGGYQTAQSAAFRRSELLSELFPRDSHRGVPDSTYGGSPLAWFYYAHQIKADSAVAYLLQAESDPAPLQGRLVAAKDGAALYVVDEKALAADRARRPPVTMAKLYRMSKRTLFTG